MIDIIVTYLIPFLLLLTILFLLRVLVKVNANAKIIDSPDSINHAIQGLRADVGNLRKGMKKNHLDMVKSLINRQDEAFRNLINDSLKRSESNSHVQESLVRVLSEQGAHYLEIKAILSALRDQASNADKQLRRYQDGYNLTINKSLILGIVRALDEIAERLEGTKYSEMHAYEHALELVREDLEILLQNEGVMPLTPCVGDPYNEHRGDSQAVPIPTDDAAKDGTIAMVLRPGYVCDTGVTPSPLLRPAKVAVYQCQSTETEKPS